MHLETLGPIFLALALQTGVIIWRFSALETKVETLWKKFLKERDDD